MSKLFGVRNTLPCSLCTRRNYTYEIRVFSWVLLEFYTFHRSNALSLVRKYGLEFFQPLAAPQPTKNHIQRLRWGQVMDTARYRARRRGNNKIAPTRRRRRSRTVWDHGDSGTQRMSSIGGDSAELRRNAGQRTRETETAKRHQTRRWRSSRTVRDHGDSRKQRMRQNGGD